ncbi:MAG: BrnT family toxin [Treponema sp.]|nr:BrnT family toxin [Treponema sp.]
MIFEWDDGKNYANLIKHGVRFEAAAHVFSDPQRMERPDADSEGEERWQTMGFFGDVLFVVYTERGEAIRIISARPAEPFERRIYHGDSEVHGWRRV